MGNAREFFARQFPASVGSKSCSPPHSLTSTSRKCGSQQLPPPARRSKISQESDSEKGPVLSDSEQIGIEDEIERLGERAATQAAQQSAQIAAQAARQSTQDAQMAQMQAMMQRVLGNSKISARRLSEEIVAKQAAESARFRSRGELEMMRQEVVAHHRQVEESAAAATSETRVAEAANSAEQSAMLAASQTQQLRVELQEAANLAQGRESRLEHSTGAAQEAQARAL